MLVDGAVLRDTRGCLFCVGESYFGFGDRLGTIDACVHQRARQLQLFAVRVYGLVQHVLERVLAAKLEVVLRE